MTSAPNISPDVIEWGRRAGFAFTPEDHSGAALFWTDPGGETRLLIRNSASRTTVTSADRGEAEVFVFSSPHLGVVEYYLWNFFGTGVRDKLGLPWLRVPTTVQQLADGFTVDRRTDEFVYLLDGDREEIAQARDGVIGVMYLVVVSHLLGKSVDSIRQTYESLDGRPIFPQDN